MPKSIHFIFLALIALVPLVSYADPTAVLRAEEASSAVGVVCNSAQGAIESVELLDLYEGREVYGFTIEEQESLEEALSEVREKWNVVFKDVKGITTPSAQLDEALASMTLADSEVKWETVESQPLITIAQGCFLERIAHRPDSSTLQLNKKLWTAMNDTQRAAVLVHEALLAHDNSLKTSDEQRIRKIVALLFSTQPLNSLTDGIPDDANECTAFNVKDSANVAFHFFKFQNPKNDIEEVLQFTKFRGQYPLGITTVVTPKWSWSKEEGDLFKEVQSAVEDYEPLYIRREFSASGGDEKFFFAELSGDYQVACAKSPQSPLSLLKVTSLGAFDSVAVGGRRTLTFEVSNLGDGKALSMAATNLAAPFSFVGGSYPGQGGTCSTSLAAKTKCLVVIQFAPQSTGNFSGAFTIKYYNGASSDAVGVDISGMGMGPSNLTITDVPGYVFSGVPVGSTRDHTLRISNLGGLRATQIREQGLKPPFQFKGGSFPGEGGTCAEYLDTNSSCNLVITFAPKKKDTFKATVELFYFNGAHETMTAKETTGTAVLPGLLTVSGSDPMDMGEVAIGSSVEITLSFKNIGETSVTSLTGTGLASPFSFANGYFPGKGGTCSSSVSVGATCTMVLRFIPMVTSLSTERLEVFYFDGASRQVAGRDLVASGASPAVLTISDAPKYNFGFVSPGTTVERFFTIANVGAVVATQMSLKNLDAPYSFVGGVYPGTGGTCAKTLAAGATCTVRVAFAPQKEGEFSSVLHVNYSNGTAMNVVQRELYGRAGEPAQLVMATGTLYSFGAVDVGASSSFTFTIFNTGKTAASELNAASQLDGPFAFVGGTFPGTNGTCGESLEVYKSCTVVVFFSPSQPGPFKKTLALSYFNGVAKQIVVQYLEGTGLSTRGQEPWNLLVTGL